jgi:hypothetical protein
VSIICPENKQIEIGNALCTVKVPGAPKNQNLKHIVLRNSNTTEPTDIKAEITVEGIEYTVQPGCAVGEAGTFENGVYKGTSTFTGFEDNEGVEGTKVGLHVF